MNEIERLERRILGVESALILLSIAAIGAADHLLAPDTSLGFLYLIPLSYSALTHRWPWFVSLVALCVALRQWDTPVATQSGARVALDWALLAVFVAVVVPLRRLGRARAGLFKAAREQRDELVHEVEMAAAVQRQLLEQHRPPAGPLDIVARTQPARVVGGDYYDFVDMGDGRLAVVVADVSGKGLPAALVMPAVKIALRALVERHRAIPDLLAELNRVLLDNLPPASYLTLVFAVFDPARRLLVYATAGHPPVLYLRDTGAAEWLSAGGPAVGLIHEDVRFETEERGFGPGDLFVFYTDGIMEAEDGGGSEFGRERIATAARGNSTAAEAVAAVHAAAAAFRSGAPQADDATVIAVRVPAGSPPV